MTLGGRSQSSGLFRVPGGSGERAVSPLHWRARVESLRTVTSHLAFGAGKICPARRFRIHNREVYGLRLESAISSPADYPARSPGYRQTQMEAALVGFGDEEYVSI